MIALELALVILGLAYLARTPLIFGLKVVAVLALWVVLAVSCGCLCLVGAMRRPE